jgi:exonuclease III
MNLGRKRALNCQQLNLIKYAVIVICIYRCSDGKLGTFLNKLELIMQKLMMKCKTFILCGDWNINFFQTSSHTKELNNLLLRYNLKHIVNVPTRITKITETLLDVLITNEKKSINSLKVMDLGLSDKFYPFQYQIPVIYQIG